MEWSEAQIFNEAVSHAVWLDGNLPRQPLPEGFGYVVLFGGFIGALVGTLYVLGLMSLFWRSNQGSAKHEANEE